jgi:hypothetical protein
MEASAKEVTELQKRMQIAQSTSDRLKEENAAYKKQNAKLVDDLKALEDDYGEKTNIERRNDIALQGGITADSEALKAKVK